MNSQTMQDFNDKLSDLKTQIDNLNINVGTNQYTYLGQKITNLNDAISDVGVYLTTDDTNFSNDNRLIRSTGTSYGVQASGIIVDDNDNMTIPSINDYKIPKSSGSEGQVLTVDNEGDLSYTYKNFDEISNNSWDIFANNIESTGTSTRKGFYVSMSKDSKTISSSEYNYTTNPNGSITINDNIINVYNLNETTHTWSQLGSSFGSYSLFGLNISDNFYIQGEHSLNYNGDTIVMGDYTYITGSSMPGRALVYNWNGTSWLQKGYSITGKNTSDWAGFSVDCDGSGDTIIMGLPRPAGGGDGSRAQVFDYRLVTEDEWNSASVVIATQTQTDVGTGTQRGTGPETYSATTKYWIQRGANLTYGSVTNFGLKVCMSSDGNIAAVSADEYLEGHVLAYKWDGNSWNKLYKKLGSFNLAIRGDTSGDNFGYSLAMNDNGKILAISSPINNSSTGQVKVYIRAEEDWQQLGEDILGENSGDRFGERISLSSDGNTLAVISRDYQVSSTVSGSLSIFKYINSVWTKIGPTITPSNTGDMLGSVCLSGDGKNLITGHWNYSSTYTEGGLLKTYKQGQYSNSLKVGNNLYIDGNIGVGTSSPGQALDVIGNIQGSSNLYIDGNIGVGTSSPGGKMHIQDYTLTDTGDSNSSKVSLQINTTGGESSIRFGKYGFTANEYFDIYKNFTYNGTTVTRDVNNRGSQVMRFRDDGGFEFNTSSVIDENPEPVNRVIITKEGNVGIGTNTPGTHLHVFSDNIIGDASDLDTDFSTANYPMNASAIISGPNNNADTSVRLYLGNVFESGVLSASFIQASNVWKEETQNDMPSDHGDRLFLNPKGGNVGINCKSKALFSLDLGQTAGDKKISMYRNPDGTNFFGFGANHNAVKIWAGNTLSGAFSENGRVSIGRFFTSQSSYFQVYPQAGQFTGKGVARVTNATGSYRNDWSSGWGGGIETWDICCAGIRLSSTSYRSDDRIKVNEEYIDDATSIIKKIKIELYDKKNDVTNEIIRRECGVIAQQIWYEVPELRHTVDLAPDADPQPLPDGFPDDPNIDPDYDSLGWGSSLASVSYTDFIGYLIKGFQEQQTIIEDLKARIEVLESA